MKRIPIKYMQLHNPLFLAGINLGTKLDVSRRPMSIVYDREFGEVQVFLNGQLSIIPLPAVSDMIPIDTSQFDLKEPEKAVLLKPVEAPKKLVKAQVSSPVDHVFTERAGNVRD